MENKRYYWLKLKDDFFDDKYIKALKKLPSGDSIVLIYLKMQLRALKTNGYIYYDKIMPNIEDELSLILDEDINIVKLTLASLSQYGLIEFGDDSIHLIAMPIDTIGNEGSSSERMRRYRERQKALKQLENTLIPSQCDTNVTNCYKNEQISDVDINIDKELEINEELDLEVVIDTLKKKELLSEHELITYPYKEKISSVSHALTYGSILKIAVFVLERLRISPIIRYKQFEIAFDNRVKEEIKNAKQNS